MLKKTLTISNRVGLHLREADFFQRIANQYKSSIWLETNYNMVNAKSLLGILSAGIMGGMEVELLVSGADEEEALKGLTEYLESGCSQDVAYKVLKNTD